MIHQQHINERKFYRQANYIYINIFYIYILKINWERPTQGSYFSRANPLGTVFLSCRFAIIAVLQNEANYDQNRPRAPWKSAATPGVPAGSLRKAEPGPNTLLCFSSSAFPFSPRWLRFLVQEYESDRLLDFCFSKYWKPGGILGCKSQAPAIILGKAWLRNKGTECSGIFYQSIFFCR